jgi:hypothetical protein
MTHAAVCGFSDIVLRLLDAGVDVNQRYRNNVTALMWAASYQDGVGIRAAESVIDLLLKSGAEVDAVNDRGCTALTRIETMETTGARLRRASMSGMGDRPVGPGSKLVVSSSLARRL